MIYDATTTRIFNAPPYSFFSVVGITFASSLFILLLLKYEYDIRRYTKIFFLSGIGMLLGAKLFGCLSGLYAALANNEQITLQTFINTGIVFYGGLIGFIITFLLICKLWNKKIEYRAVDLAVVCIPLFHFWGRLGCFFGGCCYGKETNSRFSILYTTRVMDDVVTASRFPVQLVEAFVNLFIFISLFKMLSIEKVREKLLIIYLLMYAFMRIILEYFRGDLIRGVWNGVSFSQVVSIVLLVFIICSLIINKKKEKNYVG